MASRPIVLLHGYSASAKSLGPWRERLLARGYEVSDVHVGEYVTLSNEITIKDIAEAFDRALRISGPGADAEFDVIVHSTAGLVIRSWLTTYTTRRNRVKHIIGLAPAMFGSPLAHKGRSWLGAVFKGSKSARSPDFLEAGDQVLSGLELGSRFSWELAELDLLGEGATYGAGPDSPWPFVFIGLDGYGGLRAAFTHPDGSDGTVRWAGAGLNTRKLRVDLRRVPGDEAPPRVELAPWSNVNIPFVLVPGVNHGTIVSDPPEALVDMVIDALAVEDLDGYHAWGVKHPTLGADALDELGKEQWQQFVLRVVDERGDPVTDYYLDVGTREGGRFEPLEAFGLDVHAYTEDPSFRCFHVNLTKLRPAQRSTLALRVMADSGTDRVAYYGIGKEQADDWDALIDITPWLHDAKVTFFYPFTTTLVELVVNREPMPPTGANRLLYFVD